MIINTYFIRISYKILFLIIEIDDVNFLDISIDFKLAIFIYRLKIVFKKYTENFNIYYNIITNSIGTKFNTFNFTKLISFIFDYILSIYYIYFKCFYCFYMF